MTYVDLSMSTAPANIILKDVGSRPNTGFTQIEHSVLVLSKHDSAWSVRAPHWLKNLLRLAFGLGENRELANPKLEALRRFAVLIKRGRLSDRELQLAESAGYSPLQLDHARLIVLGEDK